MHVENVRSVIEELEREYAILSEKLNEHEKQTDGKTMILFGVLFYLFLLAIDRIINNLDRELKSKQKELEQLKVNRSKKQHSSFSFHLLLFRLEFGQRY